MNLIFSMLMIGRAGQIDHIMPRRIDQPFGWRRFEVLLNYQISNAYNWVHLEESFFSGANWSNFPGLVRSTKTGGDVKLSGASNSSCRDPYPPCKFSFKWCRCEGSMFMDFPVKGF